MNKSAQYLTEQEIFETVQNDAKNWTQNEMAEHLKCSQPAVSQMLKGHNNMLGLAVKWLEMRMPAINWSIETDKQAKPIRYYKALQLIED